MIRQMKNEITNEIMNNLQENNNEIATLVDNKLDTVRQTTGGTKTYAEKLKTKNVLVVKSTHESNKAAENMKSIMSDIKAPVENVKPTKDGHLVVNFANKKNLDEAKKQLEGNKNKHNVTVNEKNKLKPKIKIVNVSKEDDDVINGIILKSPWLEHMIGEEDDFKLIKEIDARNRNMKHCIIKCSPKIRKAIHDRQDKVSLLYQSCNVYDTYQVHQCYKCQGFNHSADKCSKGQTCGRCGGNHRLADCKEKDYKCINCVNHGKSVTNHRTYDLGCPLYQEELSRQKNNTDHGFD